MENIGCIGGIGTLISLIPLGVMVAHEILSLGIHVRPVEGERACSLMVKANGS